MTASATHMAELESPRIGDAIFDALRRQLAGPGGRVALSPKEFEFLALLLQNRPRVLSKEEIQDALWPDSLVTETSLSTLVNELRRKIGQRGRNGPIRTVHGVGYALADEGMASSTRDGPRLVRGTAEIVLTGPAVVLGREPGMPGTIDDQSVSRRHARLTWDGTSATLADLGSKNGTFVRGSRIADPVVLEDGDDVRLGLVLLVFRSPRASGDSTTKTAS